MVETSVCVLMYGTILDTDHEVATMFHLPGDFF